MFNRKAKKDKINSSANLEDTDTNDNETEDLKNQLHYYYENDPIALAITALRSIDQMQIATPLALLLFRGLINEDIQKEDLEILGIDYSELVSIVEAVQDTNSYYALKTELNIRAAVREYDKVIKEIIAKEELDTNKFAIIRASLAKFASDNSMTDLKAAYKFMSSTEPETITTFKSDINTKNN